MCLHEFTVLKTSFTPTTTSFTSPKLRDLELILSKVFVWRGPASRRTKIEHLYYVPNRS